MQQERTLDSLGANARHAVRNHRLGVIAGLFAVTARDFVHPQLIMAGLVYALTKSTFLVALLALIDKAGILGPQLLVSSLFEHADRRRPHFITITIIRAATYALLAASVGLLCWEVSAWTLTVFFVAFTATRLSTASAIVLFTDMTGRLIDPTRVGAFIGMRQFVGGAASIAAGLFIVQPILGHVQVPLNYFILSVVGVVLLTIDMSIWCQCREEPGASAPERSTLTDAVRRGVRWLRTDRNYRCYVLHRVAFRIAFVGLAFFIPYGTEELASAGGAAGLALLGGILVAMLKLSLTVGSLLWGKAADRLGFRMALGFGGVFLAAAPLLALFAPRLPSAFTLPLPGTAALLDLPLLVYFAALICLGFGFQASVIGGRQFLLNSAPEHRRSSYLAFVNTLTSPLTLLPLLGAWVADTYGMRVLFAGVACGGLLAVASSLAMRSGRAGR